MTFKSKKSFDIMPSLSRIRSPDQRNKHRWVSRKYLDIFESSAFWRRRSLTIESSNLCGHCSDSLATNISMIVNTWIQFILKLFISVFIEPKLFPRKCFKKLLIEEFDHGSDWTLAAGLTHASRAAAQRNLFLGWRAADGWVMPGKLPGRGG